MYKDIKRGMGPEEVEGLSKTLSELEREIMFIPGHRDRTVIGLDTLAVLVRAARDGLRAAELFGALEPASRELEAIGREEVSRGMGTAMTKYLALHPELAEQEDYTSPQI